MAKKFSIVNTNILDGWLYKLFLVGNREVEITYIINGFLLANLYYKNISDKGYPIKLLKKSIFGILPIYYFFIFASVLIEYITSKEMVPLGGIIADVLFFNVFSVKYCNTVGGALYFSCLVVTWVIYMVYMRFVNTTKKCIGCGIAVVNLSALAIRFSYIIPEGINLNFTYFVRCVSPFAVGNMLSRVINTEKYLNFVISKVGVLIINIALIFFLAAHIFYFGISLLYVLIWVSTIILLNYNSSSKVIDNPVFAFFGKRVTYIFCWHLLLNRALTKYLEMDYIYLIVVFVLTIIFAEITYQLIFKLKFKGSSPVRSSMSD